MFERNRVDTVQEPSAVPAELTFVDGAIAKGKLLVPAGRTTPDTLNGQGTFVEFEPYGGERSFVAKAQLAAVRLVGVPRTPTLGGRACGNGDFDPHAILNVSTESAWDEIRQAYVQLSKSYHPDRYSTAILPVEVREYLEVMARRINAAYAALETIQKVTHKAVAERSQPIYTSQPRG